MSQVEYQEDPSMEEILASIRRIITEEKHTASSKISPIVEASSEETPGPVSSVSSGDRPLVERALHPSPSAAPQFLKSSYDALESAPPFPKTIEGVEQEEQRLFLNPRKRVASHDVRLAKDREASSVLGGGQSAHLDEPRDKLREQPRDQPRARALEDFFSDALRPLIREWLDDHMPSLVKQIVAEQVEEILCKKIFK
jgi:uncharacterized protein